MGDVLQLSPRVAMFCGANASLVFQSIYVQVQSNKITKKGLHEGEYWIRSKLPEFCESFPFLTKEQIRYALKKLKDEGLIKSKVLNESVYDKTAWYTITEKGERIYNGKYN